MSRFGQIWGYSKSKLWALLHNTEAPVDEFEQMNKVISIVGF